MRTKTAQTCMASRASFSCCLSGLSAEWLRSSWRETRDVNIDNNNSRNKQDPLSNPAEVKSPPFIFKLKWPMLMSLHRRSETSNYILLCLPPYHLPPDTRPYLSQPPMFHLWNYTERWAKRLASFSELSNPYLLLNDLYLKVTLDRSVWLPGDWIVTIGPHQKCIHHFHIAGEWLLMCIVSADWQTIGI